MMQTHAIPYTFIASTMPVSLRANLALSDANVHVRNRSYCWRRFVSRNARITAAQCFWFSEVQLSPWSWPCNSSSRELDPCAAESGMQQFGLFVRDHRIGGAVDGQHRRCRRDGRRLTATRLVGPGISSRLPPSKSKITARVVSGHSGRVRSVGPETLMTA